MKKAALGLIALAVMSVCSQAVAAVGDIRSIDPCDAYGIVIPEGSMSNPYSTGQTAYFRIRLENANSDISWDTRSSSSPLSNPWEFKYLGISADSALQWLINPPKVGVWVSGKLKFATIESVGAPTGAGWYTDLVCSYKVQPGDLALPMTLANSSGGEAGENISDPPEYWLDTSSHLSIWQLTAYERQSQAEWDTVVDTRACSFKLGESSSFNAAERSTWTWDLRLFKAGLYLKSVDFAADSYNVSEGRVEKINVDIVGGVNTNGAGTVWAMTKDLGAFTIAESDVETVVIADGREMDGTYQVAKVTIPSGDDVSSFSFRVKGVAKDNSGTVFLSTTKSFSYSDSGNLITNFVTAAVNCVEPPPAYITVTLDGAGSKTVTSGSGYTVSAAKLTVTLSEPFTNDFDVVVAPSLGSKTVDAIFADYIGMFPYEDETGWNKKTNSVTFTVAEMDAGTLSKDLYVYVKGGDDDTMEGIEFNAAAQGDGANLFKNTNIPATLKIRKSTPVIADPDEGRSYTDLSGGVESAFTIRITDDKLNIGKPYNIRWYKTGSGTPITFNDKTLNADGEVTVNVRYNSGVYTARFQVQNSVGEWSETRTVFIQVNEAKQVWAEVDSPDGGDTFDESDENGDEQELTISFHLTEAYEDSTLYAFLVPLDEASSNLVSCKAFTYPGIPIRSGDTVSSTVAKMTIHDGNEYTQPLSFRVMLRTDKHHDGGEEIGTYEAKDFELYINNKAPVVTAVNMSGSAPVTVSGGTFAGKASMGLKKVFSLEADDVETDLTNAVTAVWSFSDPNGNATEYTVDAATLDDIVLTNIFEVAGQYKCSVKLRDKDMPKKKFSDVFEFYINVLDTPSLGFEYPDSNTFDETAADTGAGYFFVTLSAPATKQLDVLLTVTREGADGTFNLVTNHVYFRAGQMKQQVAIDSLDGTAEALAFRGGFLVKAIVANPDEDKNEDGTPWNKVYIPAEEKMFVKNIAPAILLPVDYGITNQASINVDIPITWKVSDVEADESTLKVEWLTSEGLSQTFTGTEGVFTNRFTSGGTKVVTMTVTDKDNAMSMVTLYYRVAPSKRVNAYLQGPYPGGGLSDLSKRYAEASGIGEGRLWSSGGSVSVEDFIHRITFGKTATSADLYAWGYKVGQKDNGSLKDSTGREGRDVPISKLGDSFGSSATPGEDDYFVYSEKRSRDSFFYAWVIDSKEEEATTYTGTALISPKLGNTFSYYNLSLPTEEQGDEGAPYYSDRNIEAFFSKELYAADNMGDMNADGIPDYYATMNWSMDTGESMPICQAMTGNAISNGGEGDQNGASASDLADVSSYNGDGDFLPKAWRSANPLNPSILDWGPGDAFNARYEIRGIGDGLNHPGVSEYDLSPAERYALFADYVLATNNLTGVYADDYRDATNWAATAEWTPEALNPGNNARLNPLKADTDGDGFDDGWEYYFWYYAKVGAVTNGVWGRLEGRRFDVASPTLSRRISPAEIAEAFNPHVRRDSSLLHGRDFDNDGLTDFEEYVLGTNPICWDSENDGVNDLWRVMNGLDPLSALNSDGNPDRDFMAKCVYGEDTFTVYTFANGEMFGLPTKTSPEFNVDPVTVSTNGYVFSVDEGAVTNVYCALDSTGVDTAGPLANDVEAFPMVVVGDTAYILKFELVTVPAGSDVVEPAAAAASAVTLLSSFYKAEVYVNDSKTETIWLAEKPALVQQDGTGLYMLAGDVEGYKTFIYEHIDPTTGDKVKDLYLGSAFTFASGTLLKSVASERSHMVPVNVEQYVESLFGPIGGFTWRNPETLNRESTKMALPLFNYGGDGDTYVPCAKNVTQYSLAPVVEDADKKLTRSALVRVETKKKITLIHWQVLSQYGFDPRTAWNIDDYGYVDQRWRTLDSESAASKGEAGLAVNTVPYTSRDEFLVLQYRMQMRKIGDDGIRSATASLLNGGDAYLVGHEGSLVEATVGYFRTATTYPNLPVSFVKSWYASMEQVSPFDNSTNTTIVAYWEYLDRENSIHGADTDWDGVPDGWELYINGDPNNNADGKLKDGWAKDEDSLSILQEYAGVDSCNAYTNRYNLKGEVIYPEAETITRHHPGRASGWWNKFFPTNPYERDTDGDGVMDDYEGKGWSGEFYVGRTWYGTIGLTFLYGSEENFEKYDADASSICFRGGGLNPCAVDTDGDLLPDAWEYQFAGIVFKDGATEVSLSEIDQFTLKSADGKQDEVPQTGSVIRGGMDGTWSGDACLDFDHDGLVNCQEYLVQSLRHLRYDDPYTPLMGMDPTTKKFVKFIPFCAWDGEAFHKKCLASGFTGLGDWKFSELGYFTRAPHEWDPLNQNTTGKNKCKNYENSEGAGYRIMLPPWAILPTGTILWYKSGAAQYATTDPRRWDSDEDGMDDYYELFHGLNPLLGSAAYPGDNGEYDWPNYRFDVVATIHNGELNAWQNFWTGWPTDRVQPAFDAIRHPWMIGTMECDADGDGLRNDEESLKVNVADPRNTHTDPTPLWMTDSTSLDSASFTAQYYNPDPYVSELSGYDPLSSYPDILGFPWPDITWWQRLAAEGMGGANRHWMFAFEENEGYDTDHDFKPDATELTHGVEMASDPQVFADPNRRQAIYFPGVNSAAASHGAEFRRSVISEPDLLKQFTVEFWVKPDGAASDAVLVERVCNYGASTLSNNTSVIRANFRVGVDSEGRAYGEFQGSTADSPSARVTDPNVLVANAWTHLAFTFDGSTASLYVNGALAPVAVKHNVKFLPANGIDGILQEADQSVIPLTGYRALPCATVLGADALNGSAVAVDENTTWGDFGSFFKGWIDEVRIWDGARSAELIHNNYRMRMTKEDVKKMLTTDLSEGVYDLWAQGATRAGRTGLALPAELLQHYNFVTLPGGVEPDNVMTEPPGFQAGVLDNVRTPAGRPLEESLKAGWWSATPVHSTVYWNHAVIPWIGNTVAHMPFLDGSTPDSQYWSTGLAGVVMPATASGMSLEKFTSYDYPNTANPYPYYIYRRDRYNRLERLTAVENMSSTLTNKDSAAVSAASDSLTQKWRFQLRSDFVGTSDLVPLGGAYARRDTGFWDDNGAMDAWTETAADGEMVDSDANGIPDWAEALGLVTAEAYLRALAEGLLPDGSYSDLYKAVADVNSDGVKDWWQQLYGLTGLSQEDADKDGLADFAEYLASEVFFTNKADRISPVLPMSNGKEFDYFRRAGKLYLGEMFSDHDFMEDDFERVWSDIGSDHGVYDAHLDSDEDGWSNWAEIRSKWDSGKGINESGISTNIIYETGPLTGYWQYVNYKKLLESLLDHPANCTVLDTDFTILGRSAGNYDPDSDEGFYGTGFIKYMKVTSFYAEDMAYRDNPFPTVTMTVRYNGVENLSGAKLTVTAFTDSEMRVPDAVFDVQNGENRNVNTVEFHYPTSGYLREGPNTFVVSAGVSSNSTESAGATLLGIVRNVDVGWKSAAFDVELLEESPVAPRIDLSSAFTNDTRMLYVYRYSIDGVLPPSSLDYGPVVVKDMGHRTALNEGDLLVGSDFDFDWTDFQRAVMRNITVRSEGMPVNEVIYRIYNQPVDIDQEAATSNLTPYVELVKRYESASARSEAVPVAPGDDSTILYYACPEFRWRMEGEMPDSYTAFAIRILSGGTEVWNSGTQAAPPRNMNGEYVWKAPLYPGDQTSLGKVFANTNNYTWQVTMYNSKFQDAAWSNQRRFRVNVYDESELSNSRAYSLTAAVRYFGPGAAKANASVTNGILRVEAFTSPDFSGMPAGRTFVRDLSTLTNYDSTVNATIAGLEPGSYYVRAFIDSDGDFKRSAWESWGYACPRGDVETGAIYAPTRFEVGTGIDTHVAKVYVEDADVDQDCLPDIWEYDNAPGRADFLDAKGPVENTHNGYISVNPNLQAAISDLINGGNTLGLLSAMPRGVSSSFASLMLGVPTVEPSIDGDTLGIKSLTLSGDEVKLVLAADAEDPAAGTVFVTDGMIRVTVVVKYADSLGGEWNSVEKVIEKKVEDGAVSEEFTFSLSELGLDSSKGFFKVEVKK